MKGQHFKLYGKEKEEMNCRMMCRLLLMNVIIKKKKEKKLEQGTVGPKGPNSNPCRHLVRQAKQKILLEDIIFAFSCFCGKLRKCYRQTRQKLQSCELAKLLSP